MINIPYDLCETVSDLTSLFVTHATLPANSRDVCLLVIEWAEEFMNRHASTEWDEVDYLETIDAFFAAKYRAWINSVPARDLRQNE